jgi:hypothetical protein
MLTTWLTAVAGAVLMQAAGETPALVVAASDSPVKIERAVVFTTKDAPPTILYKATNQTDADLDQFTVIAFVFDEKGVLKARQTAPARRTLEAKTTKFSTIVLDGSPITPTDQIVIGVNQAQRVNSEAWWRGDIQAAAEAAVKHTK